MVIRIKHQQLTPVEVKKLTQELEILLFDLGYETDTTVTQSFDTVIRITSPEAKPNN